MKAIHRGNGLRLAGCVVLQTLMGRFRLHSGCARPPETSERVLLSSESHFLESLELFGTRGDMQF